jgi:hypothetical protein
MMVFTRPPRVLFGALLGVLAALAVAFPAAAKPATRVAGRASIPASRSPYPAAAQRSSLRAALARLSRARAAATAPKKNKKKKRKPALHGNPARALISFQAMQNAYYIQGAGLYEGEPFSYLWPFSQALAATVSMAFIPHLGVNLSQELHARLVGLNNYLDNNNSGEPEGTFTSTLPAFDGTVAPPAGPGGTKYYDDNDWVGIELLRLYELTHSPSLLGSVEGIMAFEMAGWQENPALGCPGGIPFSNDAENRERNTVTTAPAAELATQLYKVTHNLEYLSFAIKAYGWVRGCLRTSAGLYADHLDRRGVVEPRLWSYNQGSMIGAGTLLYQTTRNPTYISDARQTAKAALAYFTPERLGSENPFFVSVYFRNLLYLDWYTHESPGPGVAQAYVDYAWSHQRMANYLFVAGSPAGAQLLVQAAVVQIYALLSSPPRTYF